MKRMVNNKHLNYWIIGLLFSIAYPVIIWTISTITYIPYLGWILYFTFMPYITGLLVKRVSKRWLR